MVLISGCTHPLACTQQHPLSPVTWSLEDTCHVDLHPRPAHLPTFLHGLPPPRKTPEECLLSLLSDGGGGNRWLRAIIPLRHPSPPSRLHMRLTPGKEANTPPVLSSGNALSHP